MNDPSQIPPSRAGTLPLVGGALALDFCNTCSGRGTGGFMDHLRTADDLFRWARHAGILEGDAETGLRRLDATELDFGPRLLARALAVRTAVHAVDAALATGRPPAQADVDFLARLYAECLAEGHLRASGDGFDWAWTMATPDALVLGPIAASAMALLTRGDRHRLKQCSGHQCGWLFLDQTKNRSRRWCEMEVCGNRAKQKRHQGRRSGAASAS